MADSSRFRENLAALAQEAVEAVAPGPAIQARMHLSGETLVVRPRDRDPEFYGLPEFERITVLGAGKASAAMAVAVEEILGDRVDHGLVVVKYGHGAPLAKIRVLEAGHPVPDQAGVRGAEALLDAARRTGENDLVIFLLSGGASALAVAPAPGLTLENTRSATSLLLECGAPIQEINAVRKHLSAFKGGQLAAALAPATTLGLIISDVVGDRLDVIGSGPTAPDPSTFAQCLEILDRHSLHERVDEPVRRRLKDGAKGLVPETPDAEHPCFRKVGNLIVADNSMAVDRAAHTAQGLGYTPLVLTTSLEGEAREVARALVSVARETVNRNLPLTPPVCILAGGETTVTVTGRGLGGRNQELALAGALALKNAPELAGRAALMSLGTDGTDGPTDAAGAMALPDTLDRARALGLDAKAFLADNNSYEFFKKTNDLITTGPTLTNVMDLVAILVK